MNSVSLLSVLCLTGKENFCPMWPLRSRSVFSQFSVSQGKRTPVLEWPLWSRSVFSQFSVSQGKRISVLGGLYDLGQSSLSSLSHREREFLSYVASKISVSLLSVLCLTGKENSCPRVASMISVSLLSVLCLTCKENFCPRWPLWSRSVFSQFSVSQGKRISVLGGLYDLGQSCNHTN